ncbi:MAG: 3-hydroxyacyl-ACP dehydratase [Ferruginibacter sp.]
MLTGKFFHIKTMQSQDGTIDALLQIDASHKIFEGHFPGQPVVPGVCMMQMIKEILEMDLGKKTQLTVADQLKFLTVIDPTQTNSIQSELKYSTGEDGRIHLTAQLYNEAVTYFKMKASFIVTD